MVFTVLPQKRGGILICLLFLFFSIKTQAEGTQQLDLNATDYSKLMTNNAIYGSFAQYNESANSRLYIPIAEPNNERVYPGTLPVNLPLFEAEGNACQVDLKWMMESEENFSHFELERSEDARRFFKLANFKGVDAIGTNAYFASDLPSSGTHYYRLIIVNLDGTCEYSRIVRVSTECSQEFGPINVYPNPVAKGASVLQIACESPKADPTFLVLDMYGRILKTHRTSSERGWIKTTIELEELPSGTYFIMSREIGVGHATEFLILD